MYEIILFGKENLQGTHHHIFADTVEQGDPNLFRTDSDSGKFSDQLNSAVVKSGEWGFYKKTNYEKDEGEVITTLSPGIHTNIADFENNYSIKLENTVGPEPISEVILSDEPNFRGKHHHLFGSKDPDFLEHGDLRESYFNDLTSSLIIKRGIWGFYRAINFQQDESILGPGMYCTMADFNVGGNVLSSAKLFSDCPPIELNEIVLYDHEEFGGRHHHVFTLDYQLPATLENKVYSIVVKSGRWALYKDISFSNVYKDDADVIIKLEDGLYDDVSYQMIELEDVQSVRQY